MSQLFTPIRLRDLEIRNRVWVSPMCQYSAQDGVPDQWHLVHLGSLARGGAGLVLTEATAVVPEGRISPADTGIWNDRAAGRVGTDRRLPARPGRARGHPARARRPQGLDPGPLAGTWPGGRRRGWLAARRAFRTGLSRAPRGPRRAVGRDGIAEVVEAFAAAARRSVAAGFDLVELHAAHGYLLHEFLSPLSNRREDAYGGSFENRSRLLLEVVDAVRAVVPVSMPLLVRISGTDWTEGGWTIEDSVRLTGLLREHGVDLVDVSSGGNVADARIPVGPGYQVDLARQVRTDGGLPSGAVGLITEPKQAEEIIASGQADVVLLARAVLRDPHWPLRAAHELGVAVGEGVEWPPQYQRAALG